MKKLILILLTLFLLVSCTGDPTSGVASNLNTFETANFKINYPFDWELIDRNKFEVNIPDNVILAIRSNLKNETFTTNINLSVDVLEKETNSKNIASSSLAQAKNTLTSFKEINAKETTVKSISSEIPAFLIEYEGKSSPNSPLIHFKQIVATQGTAVYTLTRANSPNEDESIVNMADLVLNSFVLK